MRPRNAKAIRIVGSQGYTVFGKRKLLASAVERDLARGMVMYRFLQIGTKEFLIFDEIQDCADGVRCVGVRIRDFGAARCGKGKASADRNFVQLASLRTEFRPSP